MAMVHHARWRVVYMCMVCNNSAMNLRTVPEAVQQAIELDIALACMHSQVEQRSWGLLYANLANPDHHDSNTARRIRAAQPEAAIAALTAFYQERGLTPRAKVDNLTMPHNFVARLEAHGYLASAAVLRIMTWAGPLPSPPQLPQNVAIVRAGPEQLAEVTGVQAEGFGTADRSWIAGFLRVELAHPAVRCYLAYVDGVPAASLSAFDGHGLPISLISNVATVPALRGRGLATALVMLVQAESPRPLLLEVVEQNAERIYERAGFAVRGELHQTSCWLPA